MDGKKIIPEAESAKFDTVCSAYILEVGVPGFNGELWLDCKIRGERIIKKLCVMEVPVI